ncbi:MAG TPA: hypothetical protein VF550_06880 [Polyangia bacterium]
MAIFSKKNNAKRSNEQAKVILDESLEGRPVENPVESPAVREATAASGITQEPMTQGPPAQGTKDGTTLGSAASAGPTAARPTADAPAKPATDNEELEPEPIETPPVVPIEHRFGIDDAIQLMRSLPTDPNSALVVRVVRVTLAAVNVSVEEIVADATRKEARIREGIAALEARIVDLEGQLGALRREIAAHQADLKETSNVRERLHLADQYPGPKPPPTPISATLARLTPAKPFSS